MLLPPPHPPLLVLCHHPEKKAGVLMVPLKALFSEGRPFSETGRDDLKYLHVRERKACAEACAWIRRHPDGIVIYNGANIFRALNTILILAASNWKYHNRQIAYWREGATIIRDLTGLEGGTIWLRLLRRLRFAVVRKLLLNGRTYHLVNSRQCKQLVLYLFGIECFRIFNSGSSADVRRCPVADRFAKREGEIRVCMAGDLYHHKGIDIFAAIAAEFRQWGNRPLRYTWYGGNEEWTSAVKKRLFGKGQRAACVDYPGHITPLTDALVTQDLFLLTSREESFGVAALEALACDLPVFCFDSVGISEILPEEFVCWDKEDMMEKVGRYLDGKHDYPPGYFRAIALKQSPEGRYGEVWERLLRGMREET